MSTHNGNIKRKPPEISKYNNACSYSIFFLLGFKIELETAVVNEPSVFEQLNFYCDQ